MSEQLSPADFSLRIAAIALPCDDAVIRENSVFVPVLGTKNGKSGVVVATHVDPNGDRRISVSVSGNDAPPRVFDSHDNFGGLVPALKAAYNKAWETARPRPPEFVVRRHGSITEFSPTYPIR